jgi:hypothetical protein
MEVEIFSDASHSGKRYAGAYIIGRGGEPVHVVHQGCSNSTQAEMLTIAAAVAKAVESYVPSQLIVHTDVASINASIDKQSRLGIEPGLTLLRFRVDGVQFVPDANQHGPHRQCHRHARIAAGICGTLHPELIKRGGGGGKQSANIKAGRRLLVREKLAQLGRAATERELATVCCLPVRAVQATLNWLRLRNQAKWTPAGWVNVASATVGWDLD